MRLLQKSALERAYIPAYRHSCSNQRSRERPAGAIDTVAKAHTHTLRDRTYGDG